MLRIEETHKHAVGHSVTYGISSQVPVFARVLVTRRGERFSPADCLRLRQATAADIEALLEMERLGFDAGIQEAESTFRQRLRVFPEGCLVAMCDGSVVGCVFTELWNKYDKTLNSVQDFALDHSISKMHSPAGKALYVISMTVKPEFRRGGVGKALFSQTIERMREKFPQINQQVLLVAEDWESARRIYSEAGFVEVDRFEAFFRPFGREPVTGLVMLRNPQAIEHAA